MGEPREQEQSIKDRKKLLYDADPTPGSTMGIGKPFALHLRETPAAPLSAMMKATLWLAGIAVFLLLAGAAWKASQPKAKPDAGAKKAAVGASRPSGATPA